MKNRRFLTFLLVFILSVAATNVWYFGIKKRQGDVELPEWMKRQQQEGTVQVRGSARSGAQRDRDPMAGIASTYFKRVPEHTPPRRNPFLTKQEEDYYRETGQLLPEELAFRGRIAKPTPVPKPPYELEATVVGPGRKTALMEGMLLRPGDTIGAETVVDITLYSVILRDESGQQREVPLRDNLKDQ